MRYIHPFKSPLLSLDSDSSRAFVSLMGFFCISRCGWVVDLDVDEVSSGAATLGKRYDRNIAGVGMSLVTRRRGT